MIYNTVIESLTYYHHCHLLLLLLLHNNPNLSYIHFLILQTFLILLTKNPKRRPNLVRSPWSSIDQNPKKEVHLLHHHQQNQKPIVIHLPMKMTKMRKTMITMITMMTMRYVSSLAYLPSPISNFIVFHCYSYFNPCLTPP